MGILTYLNIAPKAMMEGTRRIHAHGQRSHRATTIDVRRVKVPVMKGMMRTISWAST